MTELIKYSQIGAQDLNLGTGTFQVTLADGRVVTMDQVNLGEIPGDVSHATVMATGSTTARTLAVRASDWYNALNYDVTNAGVETGADITTFLDTVEATGGTAYFPRGTYAYATSPNFARAGVSIVADRDTVFQHTGTGNAFILDGGSTGSGILGNHYENITVQGNANSTNGIYVRAVHHSRFVHTRVKGAATTGAGILVEWCVLNEWDSPRISGNEGALSPIPLHGMKLTRRGTGSDWTTAQTILNPIMEVLTNSGGAGLYFDYTSYNTVIGGSSESNDYGAWFTANSKIITIIGTDFESNATEDLHIFGNTNRFIHINSNGTVHLLNVNGNRNAFIGGQYNAITVDSGATGNIFRDVIYSAAAGAFTNNGTDTVKQRVYNGTTAAFDADSPSVRVVHTRYEAPYGTTVAINANNGDYQIIIPTDGVAFTIGNPTNGATGQDLWIHIYNTFGVIGAATFDTAYKLGAAWTQPANGFSRSILFHYNGTNWTEIGRTAADVAN